MRIGGRYFYFRLLLLVALDHALGKSSEEGSNPVFLGEERSI